MTAPTRARLREDRGSVSVEVALCYVPLMVLAALTVVVCVRLASAASDVNAAAAAGARQSSLARSPGAAVVAGRNGATATLAGRRLTCQPSTIQVDASGMVAGGQVVVTVTCTVTLADLSGLGLPGTVVLTGTARQPVDVYRGNRRMSTRVTTSVDRTSGRVPNGLPGDSELIRAVPGGNPVNGGRHDQPRQPGWVVVREDLNNGGPDVGNLRQWPTRQQLDAQDRCLLDDGPGAAHCVNNTGTYPARKVVRLDADDLAFEQHLLTGPDRAAGTAVNSDADQHRGQGFVEEQVEVVRRVLDVHCHESHGFLAEVPQVLDRDGEPRGRDAVQPGALVQSGVLGRHRRRELAGFAHRDRRPGENGAAARSVCLTVPLEQGREVLPVHRPTVPARHGRAGPC